MIWNLARPPRLSPPQADDGGQGFRIADFGLINVLDLILEFEKHFAD
jgi:hypothetical protein